MNQQFALIPVETFDIPVLQHSQAVPFQIGDIPRLTSFGQDLSPKETPPPLISEEFLPCFKEMNTIEFTRTEGASMDCTHPA